MDLVDKTEQLTAEVKEDKLAVKTRNLDSFVVSYYEIDIEIMFSKDPFLDKDLTNNFSDVFPTLREVHAVTKSKELAESTVAVPESLRAKNMIVYVQSALVSVHVHYLPSLLQLNISSDVGHIRVYSKENKPLPQIYVKAFALYTSGAISFYKDGYTDLRGLFDYASLNQDKQDSIVKFALLVSSPKHGAMTMAVKKPSRIGLLLDDEKLLNKELLEKQKKLLATDIY
jgi:hypothetical protein